MAEGILKEQEVDCLPIDPKAVAESFGITVIEKPGMSEGVSGALIKVDNQFVIAYATHIRSEGFRRFSIGHELGHYLLEGHAEALLPTGQRMHQSRAGYRSGDQYEREADYFSARLLMPNPMFKQAMRSVDDGLDAIELLASRCKTSLLATANRYIEEAEIPMAMVVSSGQSIDYAFLSDELKEFRDITWPKKGSSIPVVPTAVFNRDDANIRNAKREDKESDLRDWFGGRVSVTLTEEIIGLGGYGMTLTILSTKTFADEDDEDGYLEDAWTPTL
ncbi:MAG: ImmA/IrrE family metallo-endopeptidase [Ectothiorhodospiraceae bacterium AqS1]|nr:ImmA/IrrE family metallo-endopeptidase [Ectothiorhodospiraceae bacterium AqS1]